MSNKNSITPTYRSLGDIRQKLHGGWVVYKEGVYRVSCPEEPTSRQTRNEQITLQPGGGTRQKVQQIRVSDPALKPGGIPSGYVNTRQPLYAYYLSRSVARQYKWALNERNCSAVCASTGRTALPFGSDYSPEELVSNKYPSFQDCMKSLFKPSTSRAFSRDFAVVRAQDGRVFLHQRGETIGLIDEKTQQVALDPFMHNVSFGEVLEPFGLTLTPNPWEPNQEPLSDTEEREPSPFDGQDIVFTDNRVLYEATLRRWNNRRIPEGRMLRVDSNGTETLVDVPEGTAGTQAEQTEPTSTPLADSLVGEISARPPISPVDAEETFNNLIRSMSTPRVYAAGPTVILDDAVDTEEQEYMEDMEALMREEEEFNQSE